jgi:hypothetical protein
MPRFVARYNFINCVKVIILDREILHRQPRLDPSVRLRHRSTEFVCNGVAPRDTRVEPGHHGAEETGVAIFTSGGAACFVASVRRYNPL